MSTNKETFLQLIDLLKETDEEHPLTANQMAAHLDGKIERRALYRDLALLESWGMDIIPCADNKKGYFLGSQDFENWEIKLLIDSLWQAQFITPAITSNLSHKILSHTSKRNQQEVNSNVMAINRGKTDNKETIYTIEKLLTAIEKERQVSFFYYTYDQNLSLVPKSSHRHQVNPYYLHWDKDRYYLLSTIGEKQVIFPYRIDRIGQLELTGIPRRKKKTFSPISLEELLKNYIYTNTHHYGGSYVDKIQLSLKISDQMAETMRSNLIDEFGINAIHPDKSNPLVLHIETTNSPGLLYLLLQYGENLQVLGPDKVREKYIASLKKISEKYYD